MKRLILAATVTLGMTLPAMAQGAIPQPVYFWSNVAEAISAPGQRPAPEIARPSVILMFADGSWDVGNLHWSSWGSSVAHATGTSSASNDIPNAAQGKRIEQPARVTLSNPGRFQGREVYRCFTLTLPAPASTVHLCLTDQAGYWVLAARSTPKPAVTAVGFVTTAGLNCEIHDEPAPGADGGVLCESRRLESAGGEVFAQKVTLQPNGHVTRCAGGESQCQLGNAGAAPTFKPGRTVTVGRFTCKVLAEAVECTVTATGKGFLITPSKIRLLGG